MALAEGVGSVDATTYHTSASTGNAITNQFQDADLTTYDGGFRYLSRSDWQGTWPDIYQDGSWEAPQELVDATRMTSGTEDSAQMPTFGSTSTSLTLAQLIGAPFDDPRWEQLMDQMGKQELRGIISHGENTTCGIAPVERFHSGTSVLSSHEMVLSQLAVERAGRYAEEARGRRARRHGAASHPQ